MSKISCLRFCCGSSNTGKTYSSIRLIEARLGIPDETGHQPTLSKPPIITEYEDGTQEFSKYNVYFDPHRFFAEIWEHWPHEFNEFSGKVPFSVFDDTELFANLMVEKEGREFLLQNAIVVIDETQYFEPKEHRKLKKAIIGRRHRGLEFHLHSWRPVTIPREILAGIQRIEIYRMEDIDDVDRLKKQFHVDVEEITNLKLRCGDCVVVHVSDDPFFDDGER